MLDDKAAARSAPRRIMHVTFVNAAEMVSRLCLSRTPLAG
jgi:hypothetical protein